MSRVTKEINKISMAVISISAKVLFYAAAATILIAGAKKGYAFGHSIFYAPGMDKAPGVEKIVTLDGSESIGDVGKLLEDIGLIRDHNAFSIQARCYGYEVMEGTWTVNTSMTSKEIIGVLDEAPEGDESL